MQSEPQKFLKISHFNVCSLYPKLDELHDVTAAEGLDIVFLLQLG